MKKMFLLTMAIGLMVVSLVSVAAEETVTEEVTEFVSNMDAETFLVRRLEQIQSALDMNLITDEQAASLIAHIEDVAATGAFGNGPTNGSKGDGNAICVLGENDLGIFRSESAGNRTGNGNGVGQKLQEGTGEGTEQSNGRGQGNGREKNL